MIELKCHKCGKLLKIPDEYRGTTGKCNGCGNAVHVPFDAPTVTQKSLVSNPSPSMEETEHEALPRLRTPDWRDEPASEKQLSCLAELGATASQLRNLTKGQAAELMDILQEPAGVAGIASDMARSQREMASAQNEMVKAAKRHTNWQKNACGVVLLIILAPIWIPACGYILSQDGPDGVAREAPRRIERPVSPFSPAVESREPEAEGVKPNVETQDKRYPITIEALSIGEFMQSGSEVEFGVTNGSPYRLSFITMDITCNDSAGNYITTEFMILQNLESYERGIGTLLLMDVAPGSLSSFSARITSITTDDRSVDEKEFMTVIQ